MGCVPLIALLVAADAPAQRLADIQAAPAFALSTQDGQPLALADRKGQVLLVRFIFTTCNGSCPATTSRLVQVQGALARRGGYDYRVK